MLLHPGHLVMDASGTGSDLGGGARGALPSTAWQGNPVSNVVRFVCYLSLPLRPGAAESMVAAALPDLGLLVDVLRHRTGAADQWVRRIFAQFADGTQPDLAVVAQAEVDQRRRGGGAPDFIPLYQVPAPPGSPAPDSRAPSGGEPSAAYAVTGDQVREWAFSPGWRPGRRACDPAYRVRCCMGPHLCR